MWPWLTSLKKQTNKTTYLTRLWESEESKHTWRAMQMTVQYKHQLLLLTNPDICPELRTNIWLMLSISSEKSYCYLKLNMSKFEFEFSAFPLNLFPNFFCQQNLLFLLLQTCYFYPNPTHFFLYNLTPHFPMTYFRAWKLLAAFKSPSCSNSSWTLLQVTITVVRLLPSSWIFPRAPTLPTAGHKPMAHNAVCFFAATSPELRVVPGSVPRWFHLIFTLSACPFKHVNLATLT